MQYFRMRNWEKFQHYHYRNPPWIKLPQSYLEDEDILKLTYRSQIVLLRLWLVASQCRNVLRNDQHWLKRKLNIKRLIDLKPLETLHFIEFTDIAASNDASKSASNLRDTDKDKLAQSERDPDPIRGGPVSRAYDDDADSIRSEDDQKYRKKRDDYLENYAKKIKMISH